MLSMKIKSEQMLEIMQDLNNMTFSTMQKEEAIAILFKYIKKQIPVDLISCFSVNRETMTFTSFLEYTEADFVSGYSYQLKKIFPKQLLNKHYGKDFDSFFIVEDVTKQSSEYTNIFKSFPHTFQSLCSFCIYFTEKKNFYIIVSLFSKNVLNFTQEHINFCAYLRPFLKNLILPLYLKNPDEYLYINPTGSFATTFHEQLYLCPSMQKIMPKVKCVAKYDTSILIYGETGTGKDLVAESIHALSPRFQNNFVRVNCAAIPESLLEGEWFGYEKGAFTGAIQTRKGYFEQANNGTIFLDEIGELSLNGQTRLLRVIENREIQRIGSDKVIKLDVRIIVATHRNLEEMVEEKKFRKDLFYRINVIPIEILPLAKRRDDIAILIEYFYKLYVNKFQLKNPPRIRSTSILELINYSWPGNVRELRNTIERALLEALSLNKQELDFTFLLKMHSSSLKKNKHNHYSEEELQEALRKTHGKIQGKDGAATLLSLHPATLRSRLKVLGIPFGRERLE